MEGELILPFRDLGRQLQPSLRLASTLQYAGQSSAKARISDRILHVHVPRLMHPASAISSARGWLTIEDKELLLHFYLTSSPLSGVRDCPRRYQHFGIPL